MTGVDLEHLSTRRFQIEEICRSARVLPIMVGMADKSGEVSLLTEAEQDAGYILRFNLSAFMRGDYKSRQEGLQIQRRNGVISADEWRELEDMAPRDDSGGAQYIVEANMALQDGRDLPRPTGQTGEKDS